MNKALPNNYRGGIKEKKTGRFDTYEELKEYVREGRKADVSYLLLAKDCQISTGTVSNVMKDVNSNVDPEKKRLNKLLNTIWKPHGLIIGGMTYEEIYRI